MKKKIDQSIIILLIRFQKNEITEHYIYARLAQALRKRKPENSKILQKIADDELRHYSTWKKYSQLSVRPRRWQIFFYYWVSRIFGITFGIKLMEKGEEEAQINYEQLIGAVPEAKKIMREEDEHEKKLINLINEERLNYAGSIVLGLNDALVELTGTLAGLSFALQQTRLVAIAGLITGIAASFSMAASEYLSSKADGEEDALKSCFFTGMAYIVTVALLVFPYFVLHHYLYALLLTLVVAILIIFVFNYYISVAKDYNFKKRFFEMAFISLGVAALSFGIGYLVRMTLGIEV
jgi:vacuolar iron transporter family protein